MDILIFLISAAVILVAGSLLAKRCDELADRTGLGEAIMGALILGAITSLAGITASVTAAWNGAPSLSLANAYGGIAVQTLFIAIADVFYPRANLEHAAASLENLLMGVVLLILLSLLLFAAATPEFSLWHVHPVSYFLPMAYVGSLFMLRHSRDYPMWHAQKTRETRQDTPDEDNLDQTAGQAAWLWISMALMGVAVITAGWQLTESIQRICDRTGLDESLAGGLLVAVVTSLPELVTSIAAVRHGALTLAVGGILGGNAFDTLFAAVADYVYREGPIYARVTDSETGILSLSMAMTALILLGLLKRQKKGPAGIGFESAGVIVIYIAGMALLFFF